MPRDAQRLKSDAGGGAVQQAPEASIGTLEGSMQRGASLNVPPPVARTAGGLKGNWALFWGAVQRDHFHAGLIWNEGTRAELREALQVQSNCLLTSTDIKLCLLPRRLPGRMRYTIQRSHESGNVSAVDDKRWQQPCKHLHQACIPQH